MNKLFFLLFILLSTGYQPKVFAAFCSLRDPIAAISTLYHENTQHRSMVNSITQLDRKAIMKQLPFTIHRNEIGKHTLYLIYDNETPQGFVQARSELSSWGFIEIAWAINIDMSIKDFYYQRCRSPICTSTTIETLRTQIAGKSFQQLKTLLTEQGELKTLISKDPEVNNIALLTIQSALKTIILTENVWLKDINSQVK